MDLRRVALFAGMAAIAACSPSQDQPTNQERQIKVRSAEQNQLHKLDAINLAIALKRAIYDSGYACQRIDKEGYVGEYKNLDMWTAHCSEGRDWAIFAGPDGSAQVRDCVDVAQAGLPNCEIKEAPQGSLEKLPSEASSTNTSVTANKS